MFCTKCGANLPDDAYACSQCGAIVGSKPAGETVPPVQPSDDDVSTVKRIRDNAKTCATLWIVLGAIQCLTCVGIIAGVWNIVMGVRGIKAVETIVPGNRAVYEAYDNSMTMLIISAVINFLLGGFIGCGLSAFEYAIRDQVIKNKKAFGA